MKHAVKSALAVLLALALTLSFFGCMAEKNMVTDGIEKFDEISSDYKIEEKDMLISESSDKNTINYTYSFDFSAGSSKVTLLASADKNSKEFIKSSVWFIGSGQNSEGEISQNTVDDFCKISGYSIISFTGLTEADADSIIEELKVNLPESYNGKTSYTKDMGNYRFGFSSTTIMTGFTIENLNAKANSSTEDVTAKDAQ